MTGRQLRGLTREPPTPTASCFTGISMGSRFFIPGKTKQNAAVVAPSCPAAAVAAVGASPAFYSLKCETPDMAPPPPRFITGLRIRMGESDMTETERKIQKSSGRAGHISLR